MSYLGQVELKSSEIRRVDVTGSTSATHTLTWTPASEQSLIITINGIKQQNNYSISGTTLTLDDALISTDAMEVIGILDIGEAVVPPDDSITNAMVNSSAAIAQSKLSLDITNSEINASAAIAKTKLASLDIVNADVNASAAIAQSKLATLAIDTAELADDAVTVAKLSTSGTEADNVKQRVCKAWMTFNTSTGTPAILDDFNFSSITDNGVGNFTVNFTTSMGDANYSALVSTRHADGVTMAVCPTVDNRTTASYKVWTVTSGAVAYDPVSDGISTIVFGDSA